MPAWARLCQKKPLADTGASVLDNRDGTRSNFDKSGAYSGQNPVSAYTPSVLRLTLLVLCCTAGCQQANVGVRLIFPSEQTFLASALARIDVYDGGDTGKHSPEAICRSLSVTPPTPPAGVAPIVTSGTTDVCLFRAGGVDLKNVGVGRRVFFVEAQDFNGQAILRGCSIKDVFGDVQALEGDEQGQADDLGVNGFVDVQLATLPEFSVVLPSCKSIDDKCVEKVSCIE